MKIIPLVCPKCGGAINVTNKGSGVYQCPFCDTPIYFDDDVNRSEKNVNIKKEIYNYEIKEDKTKVEALEMVFSIIALFVIAICLIIMYLAI